MEQVHHDRLKKMNRSSREDASCYSKAWNRLFKAHKLCCLYADSGENASHCVKIATNMSWKSKLVSNCIVVETARCVVETLEE
jgi:hypothetical protein